MTERRKACSGVMRLAVAPSWVLTGARLIFVLVRMVFPSSQKWLNVAPTKQLPVVFRPCREHAAKVLYALYQLSYARLPERRGSNPRPRPPEGSNLNLSPRHGPKQK